MSQGLERILEALRRERGRPCSGAALSDSLGVSRTQVWKYVETLRGRGYRIAGEPGGGYRLEAVPDRLYPEEIRLGLPTRWLAREIHHFETTDSTNRVAAELGRSGAPHGTTVVAEGQTAGRGRLGRSFLRSSFPRRCHGRLAASNIPLHSRFRRSRTSPSDNMTSLRCRSSASQVDEWG